MPANKPSPSDAIEGPAVIGPDHVQDRTFYETVQEGSRSRRVLSSKPGWRRLSALEREFEKGALDGGNRKYNEHVRLEAGKAYSNIAAKAYPSGRDSTNLDRVSSSAGGSDLADGQADAVSKLISIDSHLSQRDRTIIRLVCTEGHTAAEAVRAACGRDYDKTVPARLREALDGLIEAIETARRNPGAFNVG